MAVCPYLAQVTVPVIIAAYERMGYRLFTEGDYNVNLFAIRTAENQADTFNDCIGVLFKIGGNWTLKKYDATTDPGSYYRLHPMNSRGTAILAPGQHAGASKLGYHQGKYKALVQNKPLPLYRDNDKDSYIETDGTARYEIAGINLHRANANYKSKLNQKYSAGCLVVADPHDFNELLTICEKAAQYYGNSFTCTLFTQEQVFPS